MSWTSSPNAIYSTVSQGALVSPSSGDYGSQTTSVTVPEGTYYASASCIATNFTYRGNTALTFGDATGSLTATGAGGDQSYDSDASVPDEGDPNGTVPGGFEGIETQQGAATLPESGIFTLSHGGTITERCAVSPGQTWYVGPLNLAALRVGS